MSKLSSELREFSAESQFKWNIKNFTQIDWMKNFVVKSEEVVFKEANAKWLLKLSPFIYGQNNIFLVSKFYLCDDNHDENAKYRFDITLKDGTVLSSPLIPSTKSPIEYEMTKYIPLNDGDEVELTPKVTFYTLKFSQEVQKEESPQEDDFDHCLDAEKVCGEDNKKSCCDKDKKCDCSTSEEDSSDESLCGEASNGSKDDLPISKMNDMDLSRVISKIYLGNMKKVADTSAALLISAAKNNYKELLAECSSSLAAQINSKNFSDVWEIAARLNIEDLKNDVIKFVVANRDKVRYTGNISPILMLNVVRALD